MAYATPAKLSTASVLALGSQSVSGGAATSTGVANRAYIVRFFLYQAVSVSSMFDVRGAASGNTDLGIYNSSFALLRKTGAIAQSSQHQVFNLTSSITLSPGVYYMALSASGTASVRRFSPTAGIVATMGVMTQESAHPLPDPLVPAATQGSFVPYFGIITELV